MRAIRIHTDQSLTPGLTIPLSRQATEHVARVLRLREGDAVTLFNGDGHDYPALLVGAGASLSAHVQSREGATAAESPLSITLVQALARGEKMDWIIQKAVELGVARIVPVSTQRSEVRLDAERADKRLAHWRKIIISACEQSGRAVVPTVEPPQPLHAALPVMNGGLKLVLDPTGDARLRDLDWTADSTTAAIAIGPEGGFESHELDAFARSGWRRLRLVTPILRTETAGLAAIAALRTLVGEM